MSDDELYEKLLRDDADRFAMTVCVVAERRGEHPAETAQRALGDALARMNEVGALGGDAE